MHIAEFKLKVKVHAPALQHVFFETAIEGFQKRLFSCAEKSKQPIDCKL